MRLGLRTTSQMNAPLPFPMGIRKTQRGRPGTQRGLCQNQGLFGTHLSKSALRLSCEWLEVTELLDNKVRKAVNLVRPLNRRAFQHTIQASGEQPSFAF